MQERLTEELRKLPKSPGVYKFLDGNRRVIYVGKSVNLMVRVQSYFDKKEGGLVPARNLGMKTTRMIEEIRGVEVIRVESELEALLLEARLIKKCLPKYNVVAKDDKRPLYIEVKKGEEFPTVGAARDRREEGALYFGPFPAGGTVRLVLKMLRRIFPFHQGNLGKRKCFYAHLGLCSPCPAEIEKIKNKDLRDRLKREYRKQIRQLIAVLSGKSNRVRRELERQMRQAAKRKEFEVAAKWRNRWESLNYITQSYRPVGAYLENPNLLAEERQKEAEALLALLARPLGLRKVPQRIEGFDASHLRGKQAAVSMVTFIEGEAEKSLYRRFKIRWSNTGDDLALLAEALTRRLKREEWGYPDLLLIDGGTTQVKTAIAVMEKVGERVPVVGLAKRFETLVLPKKEGFLQMVPGKGNLGMRLLMRVRDESHRFAQSYHHLLRKKALLA